jgi:acetyl-CoA carboxylase biotin carboxyl carrier protein
VKFKNIDIEKLFQMMKEHDVSELSLRDGKTTVEVKRNREPAAVNLTPSPLSSYPSLANVPQPSLTITPAEDKTKPMEAAASEEEKKSSPLANGSDENYHTIQTPLVGTFYRSSSPDAEPFVEVGDQIKRGDVLCIVEAMKSMNEIQADVNGVVKEICVNNAELVEYEQPLFKIEPSG